MQIKRLLRIRLWVSLIIFSGVLLFQGVSHQGKCARESSLYGQLLGQSSGKRQSLVRLSQARPLIDYLLADGFEHTRFDIYVKKSSLFWGEYVELIALVPHASGDLEMIYVNEITTEEEDGLLVWQFVQELWASRRPYHP